MHEDEFPHPIYECILCFALKEVTLHTQLNIRFEDAWGGHFEWTTSNNDHTIRLQVAQISKILLNRCLCLERHMWVIYVLLCQNSFCPLWSFLSLSSCSNISREDCLSVLIIATSLPVKILVRLWVFVVLFHHFYYNMSYMKSVQTQFTCFF